jgi:fructose-1,6-bisphosphatase I
MVSDIHRILFQGGIFLYPNTRKYPMGKLRLLYECNPLAFIVEQTGGKAVTMRSNRMMDIQPEALHQKATIAIGSPETVEEMEAFLEKYVFKSY